MLGIVLGRGRKRGDWMPDKKPVSDYLKKYTHTYSQGIFLKVINQFLMKP